MRSISRRSITALVPALVAAAAIALTPASVAAATRTVKMTDSQSAFFPGTRTAALGDKVKWTNTGLVTHHDVTATRPNRLFASGTTGGNIHPGGTYAYTFTSSGSFRYVCVAHPGMVGYITVPMKVSRVAGSSPERFKITIGSVALASNAPWVRVVQVDLPGGGATYSVIKTTRAASFKYAPSTHGTYRFRAYLKSTGSAGQSQTSPVVSISH